MFEKFSWADCHYRIKSRKNDIIKEEIKYQRSLLEEYIKKDPLFLTSLTPVVLKNGAPEIAIKMAAAAKITGLGPMASVAGGMAQMACEKALAAGAREAIVENGGDIYLHSKETVITGLYTGENALKNRLALKINPETMPIAICSSSSRMGHSKSFGQCDLACVLAKDAFLADSAATLAGNSVKSPEDISEVLEKILLLPGIEGILIIEQDKVGMAGKLPEIIKNKDAAFNSKITHHPGYLFL